MATGAPLSLRYHSDQLNNKVVSVMREFYQTGEFCDVILHTGNIKIHAHRIVLAAFSPYFRDLFHEPDNKHKTDINLGNHLRDECVRQLVDFCYSSNITVDSQSADKILTAANFLQIKEIEKLCITFLAAQQALKSEAVQQQTSPVFVPTTTTTQSPTQDKSRRDGLRELACADTSGIGSSNTSPRQSSRPSSVPSGNGSVIIQPLEDNDLEHVVVKKEQDESPSDQPFFTPSSSFSWSRPDYDNFRSGMPTFPGFLFPPIGSAFTLPVTTSVQHQLLMKALTKTSPSSGDPGEVREGYLGKYGAPVQAKEENNQSDTEENNNTDTPSSHQCHICLKLFQNLATLKAHVMSEHREVLTAPALSPYKMMSPVRKLSTENTNQSSSQAPKDTEDYGGSNMCGTCGKSFRDPQSLKFHRYNHVLRYQCNYCGKRFSRSWNLHRHRKTHYRQLQEAGLGTDEVHPIDVDESTNQTPTPTYEVEKDLILTSPYADYRNHRHDMMPFAFDMRKSAPSCTYGMEESKDTDGDTLMDGKSGTEQEVEDADKEQTKADP
ncbi:zinc finger and BTB domain-containing protein 17-like [Ruditapes philippinarum]|uniref:zinc finger and BTB domain-containing protein 17-like n=1 Tax=Ruditapes philippinarum TaxID=129788 RepID=UPI00295B251A|nr:zinc finger and BTB domain-containing protein 17-like [Ruditapes philippinarum]XP_060569171.1 zinc finger and BTB domain-containing protein 17-like [Ruditapes philippinarum]